MIVLNDIKIKFTDDVLDTMRKYIQWKKTDMGAGGILIGRENISNGYIIIDFITDPMKNDLCTRMRFTRKDPAHLLFYKKLYDKNNGVYAYFGEWHTHPVNNPRYSSIDLGNWKKIARKDPKNIQYHIIVGRNTITFWKMKKEYLFPKLIKGKRQIKRCI